MTSSMASIAHDFPPFLRVFTDGRVQRLITIPHLPPSTDPLTGIRSKDVVISPEFGIKSRIFLPRMSTQQKLPLIIYVHGGAFCFGSPLNVVTQSFLTPLVSQTSAVAIAIGYRLAPEHPLPAAYHDCWAALQWIASHVSGAGPDPWINNYVDPSRVFLVGDSAGANLVHYLGVQAGVNHTRLGLGVRGLMVLHPYFIQKEPDELTRYLYPGCSGSDNDPKLNPAWDPDLGKLCTSRVLVAVAEKDFLKARGVEYYETLKKSKWEGTIEFVENEDEDHIFYLLNPSSKKAKALFQHLISFIKQN
ncbi:putative carboxylesterase [Helianthus annuus]|nr:putative carboxylesterase [Helianthus annuus]